MADVCRCCPIHGGGAQQINAELNNGMKISAPLSAWVTAMLCNIDETKLAGIVQWLEENRSNQPAASPDLYTADGKRVHFFNASKNSAG